MLAHWFPSPHSARKKAELHSAMTPSWGKKRIEPLTMHAEAWSMVTDPGCMNIRSSAHQDHSQTRGHCFLCFPEAGKGEGKVLLEAAGCVAQGTLEQFPVRHKCVQLKALG